MHPEERAELVASMLKGANIPPRYHCDPSRRAVFLQHQGWANAYNLLMEKLAQRRAGFVLVLCGARGTGKTAMATQAIRTAISEHLLFARYTVLEDFLGITRRPEYDQRDQGDPFFAPRILVIDEIAKSGDSAWAEGKLFHLVNTRYNDLKHSVLICAAPPDSLLPIVGSSVYDRIHEGGGVIHCNWPSFRSTPAKP